MELIIKLILVSVIGLSLIYFITLQVLKLLASIAKRGPEVMKGLCFLAGVFLILWIFSDPHQAEEVYEHYKRAMESRLGITQKV